MRTRTVLQDGWKFIKEAASPARIAEGCESICLPHTWNAQDGADGDNAYYRGTGTYYKTFSVLVLHDEELWLEVTGAGMSAQVFVNGKAAGRHDGGFSTFRVNLTDLLYPEGENLLSIQVDNSANRTVYPQKADFTFYGGLYREVALIRVPRTHFALGYFGGSGLKVTSIVSEDFRSAQVTAEAWIEGGVQSGEKVRFTVEGEEKSAPIEDGYARAVFEICDVRLWDGIRDPYMYTASAELGADLVQTTFGCRAYRVDPERGFFLNGRSYPLCGAARHQDRAGIGNALTRKEHEEDMAIMREMGCNTIRLAHYQHDPYFYDLCDRNGMVVWAEIPYITEHMQEANANSESQMKELIIQNCNHPSIICWGLSNEITAAGGVSDDMVHQHEKLNALCHSLDPTRLTAMAHAFMLDMDNDFVRLTDICSYNLYYGWYMGELEQNDAFFDAYHEAWPDHVIGLSEYGADANPAYQSANPVRGDWSESYQALYHEHMIQMWKDRPYIWAMHIWNMFDFAADGRAEGGKPGQNQKGLVTYNRKLKKDAFYLYKAYLSDDPFVHLCGRRRVDRTEEVTEIKVYSNQDFITLVVDGELFDTVEGEHIFRFRVPISGTHQIEAYHGSLGDAMTIRKADTPNPDYLYGGKAVINWFDRDDEITRDGYFSIKDSMGDVQSNPEAAQVLQELLMPALNKMTDSYGDVAKSVTMPESMQRMMAKMSIEGWMKQAARFVTPELVHRINHELNRVRKEI